jgi:hypothetical protein
MKAPSFLQAGKRYHFTFEGGSYNATLLDMKEEGWLKLDAPKNPTWININFIRTIQDEPK